MKIKLLFTLLLTITLSFANNTEKTAATTGPSIALTMFGYPMGNMIQYEFRIKNNGDLPLTNIYITNIDFPLTGYIQIYNSINPGVTAIAALAPGEEDIVTFKGYLPLTGCYDVGQTIVHATAPDASEIIDLSDPYSYYGNNLTYTEPSSVTFYQEGTYQDLNNNSIVDVGDMINYTYSTYDNGGYDAPFILLANNAIIPNPNGNITNWFGTTGYHYITQAEVNAGYVYNNLSVQFSSCPLNYYVFDPTPCLSCPLPADCIHCTRTKITDLLPNKISGSVKFNSNSDNCATGSPFPDRRVDTNDGTTTYSSFTNNNGDYVINISNTGTFTTDAIVNLGNNFLSNPSSISTVSSGENTDYNNSNFCIGSSTNYSDLEVALYPIDHARPGFDSYYRLYYHNNGSTSLNGTITLTYDNGKLSLVNANPVQSSTASNVLTWNYSNLLPFENRSIYLTFNAFVPPTVNQGDILSFTTVGNPMSGDNNTANNTFVLNQTVVSSFDPNDKTVLEGATIQSSQAAGYLHYITRFQNTGTAAATTVVLKETLDPDLDWNTFEPVGSSHNYNIQIKNGNELTCTFSNIGLADSTTNEPASHGWLAYKIKPKSTFAIGDIASSSSAIYFDFNPAIVTNTVTTQITALSNNEFNNNTFKVYPNPANNYFVIESTIAESCAYEIVDINGKLLLKGNVESLKPIDISQFQKGFYFVKVKNEKSKQTFKIIKQ